MKKIVFTKSFEKYFSEIDTDTQHIIIKKIELLAQDNEFLDIKKLEPKQQGLWRLRVGKYRIIYEYGNSLEIILLKVDSRDKIYR